ncbi:hypothetical protein [Rhodococcus sp. ARC_M6]|uniref:hypothetical protein n=1 Tax=Rhodococcus sp. ARC_M6 TaxID=2928852 RepID=UPI001FB4B31D|nr:hypothetical protein [Rhodococcus sp. ARC_M6]MCJ0907465.1 hypothetical protein [Rhodococcus sp. ARC_M6]
MVNLGILLAFCTEPPDIDSGRQWLTQGATEGIPVSMSRLGLLLAYRMDPPDPDGARHWFELATKAGDTDARRYLEELTTHS